MPQSPARLPDDPAALKAMIAALQAEKTAAETALAVAQREASAAEQAVTQLQGDVASVKATLRAHEALVQALRLQIARLKRQKFGSSSEKIAREIEQLELALENLGVAQASTLDEMPSEEDAAESASATPQASTPAEPRRRKPRVAPGTPRERIVLDPGEDCPHCGGPLRLIGEDVSEILDLIAAKRDRWWRPPGRRSPAAAASGSPNPRRPRGRSRGPWSGQRCWPGSWFPSSTTICRSTASARSSPEWGPMCRPRR